MIIKEEKNGKKNESVKYNNTHFQLLLILQDNNVVEIADRS